MTSALKDALLDGGSVHWSADVNTKRAIALKYMSDKGCTGLDSSGVTTFISAHAPREVGSLGAAASMALKRDLSATCT